MQSKQTIKILFSVALFLVALSLPSSILAINVEIAATVPGCGDGNIDIGEQCDGSDFGGSLCSSYGFSGGSLSCSASCAIDTSTCTASSVGGGNRTNRSTGPSAVPSIPATNVAFFGKAYPWSTVTLLTDAKIVATATADADANFQITIFGVSSGHHTFSFYSTDSRGVQSSVFDFPIEVTTGFTTIVSGIFIAPTISIDKNEVKLGDKIAIFGQTTPSSEVTVSIASDEELLVKTTSSASGRYLLNFDTSPLKIGKYQTKSKSDLDGETSSFSETLNFTVGIKNILSPTPPPTTTSDDTIVEIGNDDEATQQKNPLVKLTVDALVTFDTLAALAAICLSCIFLWKGGGHHHTV